MEHPKRLRRMSTRKRWGPEEDQKLGKLVERHGEHGKWREIATEMRGRTAKQCRERWQNAIDPSINKQPWSQHEDELIFTMQRKFGNKWVAIAKCLEGRTDNAVKNRFYSTIRRQERYQSRKRNYDSDSDSDSRSRDSITGLSNSSCIDSLKSLNGSGSSGFGIQAISPPLVKRCEMIPSAQRSFDPRTQIIVLSVDSLMAYHSNVREYLLRNQARGAREVSGTSQEPGAIAPFHCEWGASQTLPSPWKGADWKVTEQSFSHTMPDFEKGDQPETQEPDTLATQLSVFSVGV